MKTIIVSHESDVDGVFSAAIALMRFPQSKLLFTSYGRENFLKISEILYREVIYTKERGQIIISDLGLNDDIIDLMKETFSFLKSNSWSIIWVDHHPWSEAALKATVDEDLVQLFLDKTGNLCASEVMYNNFLFGNILAEKLSKIAHTTDFLLKDQEIPNLPELIVFYKTLPDFYQKIAELAKKISNGILWDVEMQSDFNQYVELRDEAKKISLSNIVTVKTPGGIKIDIVKVSPYIQISLFSEEVFKKTNSDVSFFLNKEGKVSIRRNNQTIQCDKIAKQLVDGGGHKYASGGKMRSNPNNLDQVIEELLNAVVAASK